MKFLLLFSTDSVHHRLFIYFSSCNGGTSVWTIMAVYVISPQKLNKVLLNWSSCVSMLMTLLNYYYTTSHLQSRTSFCAAAKTKTKHLVNDILSHFTVKWAIYELLFPASSAVDWYGTDLTLILQLQPQKEKAQLRKMFWKQRWL